MTYANFAFYSSRTARTITTSEFGTQLFSSVYIRITMETAGGVANLTMVNTDFVGDYNNLI